MAVYPGLQRECQWLCEYKGATWPWAFKQKIPRLLRLGLVYKALLATRPEGGDVARVARCAGVPQLLDALVKLNKVFEQREV